MRKLLLLLLLLLTACGPSIDDIDWQSPAAAFGRNRWVLVYEDLPD